MKITADFNKIIGKIKPMHGVGQPPSISFADTFRYLKDAGIPYSRLHDVGGWMGQGLFVDVPNIFPDFDADETDPANYEFAYTDRLIEILYDNNVEPFFRLGVTIENEHMLRAFRIYPPKDFGKWARICEHIIRHYNEGWANGFNYGITYWEIWNEPDDCYSNEEAAMWKGTPEQFYKLYETAAKHLKSVFGDKIKVGGYASCGAYKYKDDPDGTLFYGGKKAENVQQFYLEFMHGFFKHIKENNAPIDFFSWHVYVCPELAELSDAFNFADYIRKIMDMYGYGNVPDILNEWNCAPSVDKRPTAYASARTLAFMLGMQKHSPSLLCYYDARLGPSVYGGMFNPDTRTPYRTYYSFVSFNRLYELGNEVETSSDSDDLYVGGAVNNGKKTLLFVNVTDQPQTVELDIKGADLSDAEIIITDDEYMHTLVGTKPENNKLDVKAYASVEIRM